MRHHKSFAIIILYNFGNFPIILDYLQIVHFNFYENLQQNTIVMLSHYMSLIWYLYIFLILFKLIYKEFCVHIPSYYYILKCHFYIFCTKINIKYFDNFEICSVIPIYIILRIKDYFFYCKYIWVN